jgi:DNA-binding FrmR family transcriptional regulator
MENNPLTDDSLQLLLADVKNIEGQLKGFKKIMTRGKSCVEMLFQLNTIKGQILDLANSLANRYIQDALSEEFQTGDQEPFDELKAIIEALLKL